MATTYKTIDGDMLDAICHKYYGSSNGYIDVVYKANLDLSSKPIILPAGITIILPEATLTDEVSLW